MSAAIDPALAPRSIVDWAAALAGAAIATGVALVLMAFGAALGLSVASPYEGEGLSPAAFAIAAGLYLLWVQLMSFGAGGYVVGRMRTRNLDATEHEIDTRDALHGLLVWALGVIAAAVIATAGVGGATAVARTADAPSDIVASVTDVAREEIAEGAAQEAAVDPQGAVADVDERRTEVARKFAVIAAFIAAASLLVGAVVAIFMAGLGGRHRDQNTRVGFFVLRPAPAPQLTPKP